MPLGEGTNGARETDGANGAGLHGPPDAVAFVCFGPPILCSITHLLLYSKGESQEYLKEKTGMS